MKWLEVKVHCHGCVRNFEKLIKEQYSDTIGMRANGVVVEFRSLEDFPKRFLDKLPSGSVKTVSENTKTTWSTDFKFFVFSTALVLASMVADWFWVIPSMYATPFYLSALTALLWPEMRQSSKEIVRPYLVWLCMIVASIFAPVGLSVKTLSILPSVSAALFQLLMSSNGKRCSSRSLLQVFLYQGAAVSAALIVHPVFWLATALPIGYAALKVKNKALGCDWSLKLVSGLVLVSVLLTYMLSLPAMVCIHEAFLAVWLLKLKTMNLRSMQPLEHRLQHIHADMSGVMVKEDLSIKVASKGLQVSLEKCDYEECRAHLLHSGAEFHHERRYTLDQFRASRLPKGALLYGGDVIAEPLSSEVLKSSSDSKNLSQLDQVAQRLVPVAAMFSFAAFGCAMMVGLGVSASLALAMTTLLACCPCIFVMIYYFERSFERLMQKHGVSVKVNFQQRCLEGWRWPDFSKWHHVFDRTGVTHGPIPGKVFDKDAPYVMYQDAKDWLKHLAAKAKPQHACVHGLSAAGEFKDVYKSSMQECGVPVRVDQKYARAAEKAKAFDDIRAGFGGGHTIIYEDGLNGAESLQRPSVMGVAVRKPSDRIKQLATCFVDNMEGIGVTLPAVVEGQKFASKLLAQSVAYNIAAMWLPVLGRVLLGIVMPMWASCIGMLAVMGVMSIEVRWQLSSIASKYLEGGVVNKCKEPQGAYRVKPSNQPIPTAC